jgi:hypothetical protein
MSEDGFHYEIVNGRMVKVADAADAPTLPVSDSLPPPSDASPDYLNLAPLLDLTPLDEALDKVCAELGLKIRPGGASGYGWSTRSMLLACPYKYKKLYIDAPRNLTSVRSPTALEVGGLFHQLLAFHYMLMMPARGGLSGPVDFDWVKARLLEERVSAEVVMEAFRLFDAYRFRYEVDYIEPLDVEVEASDSDGNTCRYDTIVRIRDNNALIMPGIYILEHKTCARFDFPTLEGWKNDGQIIGQMYIWRQARLKRKYGRLDGVIVNLISKTKTPDFRRIVIAPQAWQLSGHAKDLKVWDALESLFRSTGCWPRNRQSCRGPYGLCSLFDHCAGGGYTR